MKLKPIYFLTAVCLVVLSLAACNALPKGLLAPTATPTVAPLTAEDILAQSAAAMAQVDSMRLTYSVKVDAAGQSMTTEGQGAFKKPDQMYLKLSVLGQDIEMLILAPEQIYWKMPGTDQFIPAPSEITAMGGVPDIMGQLNIGDFASTTRLEGEETLDGVPAYVISFDMDVAKYLHADQAVAAVFDPTKTTGKGKLWIGKEDGYIYKMAMELNMDVADNKVSTLTETFFSNFNEPVELPKP
jgi:outer membrane lipoprotein-sorting protein